MDLMEGFSVFLIVGLSFSLLLLLKKLVQADYRSPREILPTLLIAVITVELFYGWLYSSRLILNFPHLIRLNTPLVFLIGPAIFFMIRSFEKEKLIWREISIVHLVPFILVIAYLAPLYFSQAAEKVSYIESMYAQLPVDSQILGGLRRLHQGLYIIAAFIFTYRHRENIRFLHQLKSSVVILSLFAVLWLFSLYRYLFKFDLQTGYIDIALLALVSIILVYKQLGASMNRKYSSPQIPADQISKLQKEIIRLLETDKIFLDPKLNIHQFSQKLGVPYPVVSMVINQIMGTNFNELVNKYRTHEAVRLLQSEEKNYLTLEAISEYSGFNSISSFNSNFKKIMGKSPKFFRIRTN